MALLNAIERKKISIVTSVSSFWEQNAAETNVYKKYQNNYFIVFKKYHTKRFELFLKLVEI